MNIPNLKMNTGTTMPAIGFGTWQLEAGKIAQSSVEAALEVGYRLIDTAKIYGNEESVGRAIKNSGLKRGDIFVTTKLWQGDLGYDSALKAFDESLQKLGLDYLDLYLIHWPGDDKQKRFESWKALTEIHQKDRAKAVGVSNFTTRHLKQLAEVSKLTPAVNQVEFHPFMYQQQKELLGYCQDNDIVFEAYSPLARGMLNDNLLTKIGEKYSKTASQVMLRWAIQQGTLPLPRSKNPDHIKENFNVFNFELSTKDMEDINSINQTGRTSWDPTNLP
jgi:diketogulonate reductase-like aldo/keto reductase